MVEVREAADIDVFHVHYAIPHAVSAFLARSMCGDNACMPFVTTLHGTDITVVGSDRAYMRPVARPVLAADGFPFCLHATRHHPRAQTGRRRQHPVIRHQAGEAERLPHRMFLRRAHEDVADAVWVASHVFGRRSEPGRGVAVFPLLPPGHYRATVEPSRWTWPGATAPLRYRPFEVEVAADGAVTPASVRLQPR